MSTIKIVRNSKSKASANPGSAIPTPAASDNSVSETQESFDDYKALSIAEDAAFLQLLEPLYDEILSSKISQASLLATTLGRKVEFVSVQALPQLIKQQDLPSALKIVKELNPYAVPSVLAQIIATDLNPTMKHQVRQGAFKVIGALSKIAPKQVGYHLPELIPPVSLGVWDMKQQVSQAALECLHELAAVVGNYDIEGVMPAILECIAKPETIAQCIRLLSATTFVQDIDTSTLAIIQPILVRALKERTNTVLLRQTSIVIENMCKLVADPRDVVQFLPSLKTGLEYIIDMAADPELREVSGRTYATVTDIIKARSDVQQQMSQLSLAADQHNLTTAIAAQVKVIVESNIQSTGRLQQDNQKHICNVISEMVYRKDYKLNAWNQLLDSLFCSDKKDVLNKIRHHCGEHFHPDEKMAEEEDVNTVCDCEFSLAYGGRILLQKANLKLRKGGRYGVVGQNGCGKSTLFTAIAKGQVNGFPEDKKTVYVSHSLQVEDGSQSLIDFGVSSTETTQDKVVRQLDTFGFSADMQQQSVSQLSGGWKMKLELALAMCKNPDILLLDEPTNHLDVLKVQWLEQYLVSSPDLTSLIISHDTKFLDNVCTNIIHYEHLKLKTYSGNFSEFAETVPEARNYAIDENIPKFNFPDPGNIDGVRSVNKKILKVANCTYTYPGAPKPSLVDASLSLTLSSRVALKGANGAGKSTLIKLLTGETIPDSGEVLRHANLRIAYVAQHAFHHLEQHLEKTPNAYVRWRYEFGQDKELLAKATRKIEDAEAAIAQTKNVEALVGRQKYKRSHKYEVKFVGKSLNDTAWVTRERLIELGFNAMVQAMDDRENARAGDAHREISVKSVEQHLEEFGLTKEVGTHSYVGGLSGGQKVKVVLAAAMWHRPHMLVLDEPTNYLDVSSLTALSNAIREFKGAVVMVTHNTKFSGDLCSEIYEMSAGKLTLISKPLPESEELVEQPDEALEKAAIPKKIKVSRKQQKIKDKIRDTKLQKYGPKKDGTPYSSDEEEAEKYVAIGNTNSAIKRK